MGESITMGGDKKGPKHDLAYYSKCSFGGVFSCGLTHAATVSLDLHKCRSQAHIGVWPSILGVGLRKIAAEEGALGLVTGVVPTFFGYGAQGLFKFGLNEVFQDVYKGIFGEENFNTKAKKMILQGLSSGSAEFFAGIALCPFEMTKVRMQVQLPSATPGPVPMSIVPAMQWMSANAAETRFPFVSLQPLWGRQIPYTIIKFVAFYQTAEFVYDQIEKRTGKKKSEVSDGVQLGITFLVVTGQVSSAQLQPILWTIWFLWQDLLQTRARALDKLQMKPVLKLFSLRVWEQES